MIMISPLMVLTLLFALVGVTNSYRRSGWIRMDILSAFYQNALLICLHDLSLRLYDHEHYTRYPSDTLTFSTHSIRISFLVDRAMLLHRLPKLQAFPCHHRLFSI